MEGDYGCLGRSGDSGGTEERRGETCHDRCERVRIGGCSAARKFGGEVATGFVYQQATEESGEKLLAD